MRCHANARLSPIGRRLLVDRIQMEVRSVQCGGVGRDQRADRAQMADPNAVQSLLNPQTLVTTRLGRRATDG
jgi:hypothetical protein